MPNNHPSFVTPDENTTIWRYMDFTKYVSFLEKSALFFSTVGILRTMDEHEGTYNSATVEAHKTKPFSNFDVGSGRLRNFGRFLAINCWHMNEIESTAMWEVYLKGVPGIAVQSTVKNLDLALNIDSGTGLEKLYNKKVDIGKVHYLAEDEAIPEPDGFNGLNAVLWKRKSFEYERELRAVVIAPPEELYKYNGMYIPVILNQLFERVIVFPKAPRWFSELVFSISSSYGLGEKVQASRLDAKPGDIENNEFSVKWTCPHCAIEQIATIELFIVKEYLNDTSTVFSADRLNIRCQNCGGSFAVPIRLQMEYGDPSTTENKTNSQ